MRKHMIKLFIAIMLAITILVGMGISASAETPQPTDKAAIATAQKQAYDQAVKLDIIYYTNFQSCTFDWRDGRYYIKTYKAVTGPYTGMTFQPIYPDSAASQSEEVKSAKPATKDALTDKDLQDYADKVYELVNDERKKDGLAPVARDSRLDKAAMIRASEVKIVDDAGGKAHTRPDGTNFRSVFDGTDIDGNQCAENLNRNASTPKIAMDSWMKSDGHRDIILKEKYGSVGIGVYQRSDGKLDWIQIFMRK